MGRTTDDSTDFAEVDIAEEMPKPTRGNQGMTDTVKQLVGLINDKKVHRIKNAGEETKDRWGRKLRYAARRAEKDIEVVYVPEESATEKNLPGIYFKGYDKGEAPKRGLRR